MSNDKQEIFKTFENTIDALMVYGYTVPAVIRRIGELVYSYYMGGIIDDEEITQECERMCDKNNSEYSYEIKKDKDFANSRTIVLNRIHWDNNRVFVETPTIYNNYHEALRTLYNTIYFRTIAHGHMTSQEKTFLEQWYLAKGWQYGLLN